MTTYTAPPDQTGLILNNGDVLNVNGGGIATATTINDGGEVSVFRRGKTIDTTLDNGGREDVLGGARPLTRRSTAAAAKMFRWAA